MAGASQPPAQRPQEPVRESTRASSRCQTPPPPKGPTYPPKCCFNNPLSGIDRAHLVLPQNIRFIALRPVGTLGHTLKGQKCVCEN